MNNFWWCIWICNFPCTLDSIWRSWREVLGNSLFSLCSVSYYYMQYFSFLPFTSLSFFCMWYNKFVPLAWWSSWIGIILSIRRAVVFIYCLILGHFKRRFILSTYYNLVYFLCMITCFLEQFLPFISKFYLFPPFVSWFFDGNHGKFCGYSIYVLKLNVAPILLYLYVIWSSSSSHLRPFIFLNSYFQTCGYKSGLINI